MILDDGEEPGIDYGTDFPGRDLTPYERESIRQESYTTEVYNIKFYHYNKIRILYDKHYKNFGYPIKFAHYIGYYSGMGFWIPDFHVVDVTQTYKDWISLDPTLLDDFIGTKSYAGTARIYRTAVETPLNEMAVPWRSVRIRPVPNEMLRGFLDFIPFNIDQAIITAFSASIGHIILIPENVGFYGTMNNTIIRCNWDKIRAWLNSHGY